MSARKKVRSHIATLGLLSVVLYQTFLAPPARSQQANVQRHSQSDLAVAVAGTAAATRFEARVADGDAHGGFVIPQGTILPVRLNSAISSNKSRPGQVITGRIMQDVPLVPGVKIRAGTKVLGHIVERVPASKGATARVSFEFDELVASPRTIAMTTNLRTIAGFMQIAEAQVPPSGAGETEVYRWLTTVQVGGDLVYGEYGPVTSGENSEVIIGKKVNGGVLGVVRARAGTNCRGAIDGNLDAQALWVFSSDACGTYGLEHVHVAHAGRNSPVGVIALTSDKGELKIAAGAGMLLRVDGNARE
jgi:hypothetical protein